MNCGWGRSRNEELTLKKINRRTARELIHHRSDFYDLCKRWDISFVILFLPSNNSVHSVNELVSDGI